MILFKQVQQNQIKELASLASFIWHEYWTCLLSDEQINYMVEKFQSEKAIKNQIENENYTYYFIKTNPLSNGRGLNFNTNDVSVRNSGEGKNKLDCHGSIEPRNDDACHYEESEARRGNLTQFNATAIATQSKIARNDSNAMYSQTCETQLAGYFGVSDKEDYLFLSKLYIKKEFRHQGIGSQAFEKIKKIANGRKIRLTVNKKNTNTIKAYDKWGFKTVDAVVTDIGQGFVMDDYIMGT